MEHNYPLEYTLDDGIHVVVNKTGTHTFDFTLKPHEGPARHFTLNDSEEFTDEKEKQLDFDQLNALRMFWLKTRDEE